MVVLNRISNAGIPIANTAADSACPSASCPHHKDSRGDHASNPYLKMQIHRSPALGNALFAAG